MNKSIKQTINYVQKMDKSTFSTKIRTKFECQCGKIYGSFPALYLHFQRSHNKKISTKLRNQQCIVNKIGNTRTFIYYYSRQEKQADSEKDNHNMLATLFKEFTSSIQNVYDQYPAHFLCSNLHRFLLEHQGFQKNSFGHQQISEIPNYFNQFINENHELMGNQKTFKYNCKLLMKLCTWLNSKGYSDVKLGFESQDQELKTNQDVKIE